MKEYILVFAPSGVGLGEAVKKLANKLNAKIVDIEDNIKNDPKTKWALDNVRATYTEPLTMETITYNLPRSKISELWKDAVSRCLESIEKSNKQVNILSGHLIYYSAKRNEFYSVVDRDCFVRNRRLKPKCVLLLIDDIYDMYVRLSSGLYSPEQIESYLRRLERDMNINLGELDLDRVSFFTLGWEIRNLLHLLSWRHLEAIIAENLALQLGADFLICPVKQLIEAIKLWLENPQTPVVYLSHPITEPRRERNQFNRWPKVVEEINSLQKLLSAQGITIMVPTGIDELRFQVKNQQYSGYLEDRWPLVSDNETELLYSKPDKNRNWDVNCKFLLRPKYWNIQDRRLSLLEESKYTNALKSEVNAFLQALVREIEAQIASRDFLFIYHTNGLLVYRPYYAREPRPTFSGGVDAEVRLWEDIVLLGEQKRIAFVHFKEDVESMLEAKLEAKKDEILNEFIDVMKTLFEERNIKINRNYVAEMVKNRGHIEGKERILDRLDIAPSDKKRLRSMFDDCWMPGKVELLRKYLTNAIDVREELVGVWILDNFDSLKKEAENLANFLRYGEPRSNNWEEQIEKFLPDRLLLHSTYK